jgi:hypothetical protein
MLDTKNLDEDERMVGEKDNMAKKVNGSCEVSTRIR